MFTGLIETAGRLSAVQPRAEGRAFTIAAPTVAGELGQGDSVAIDGCCLTVESRTPEQFEVFASPETLSRTTLGRRAAGDLVNLERPLALGERLGGHLVTGHVDAVGTIAGYDSLGESWLLVVEFPPPMAPHLVEKGSVAVDGISLTCYDITPNTFSVAIIPETHRVTNLHTRRAGDDVNLEGDLIGKYVARHLALREGGESGAVSEDLLRRAGFVAGVPERSGDQ